MINALILQCNEMCTIVFGKKLLHTGYLHRWQIGLEILNETCYSFSVNSVTWLQQYANWEGKHIFYKTDICQELDIFLIYWYWW